MNPQSTAMTSRRTRYNSQQDEESPVIRDVHALTPPSSRHVSSSLSIASSSDTVENFTTISREFNALVLAGSRIRTENHSGPTNLGRIGEEHNLNEEINPLAIVLYRDPLRSPPRTDTARGGGGSEVVVDSVNGHQGGGREATLRRVKKAEAETKINAWQNAKVAKVNNRFKRDEAIINGWEDKQVHKASSWMKGVEETEKSRAKAVEKMQNEIAKARRKAEERKASAEAKSGTKVAKVFELANFMRAMGRPPPNRSFF